MIVLLQTQGFKIPMNGEKITSILSSRYESQTVMPSTINYCSLRKETLARTLFYCLSKYVGRLQFRIRTLKNFDLFYFRTLFLSQIKMLRKFLQGGNVVCGHSNESVNLQS